MDLARHGDTPLGDAIRRALALKPSAPLPPLLALYETDVTRLAVSVQRGTSTIELALDEGRIAAGARSLTLRELGIELKQGCPEDAVQLAREGCALHGLWLSTISKSMKGQRLADSPAREPQEPRIACGRHASGPVLVRAVVGACLEQVIRFASEVAGGSDDAEHIHQLRVGIRRLRTALRELRGLADGVDAAWEAPLVEAFRVLGRHRDRGHLARSVEPLLEAAGAPSVAAAALGQDDAPGPAEAVRAPAFQDSLLALLAFAHGEAAGGVDHRDACRQVRKALDTLHRQVMRDGARFASLDEGRQHRVRKRAKRLRYLAEFAAPLFGRRRAQEFSDRLKPVQDALGLSNDELMALRAYRSLAPQDPKAWFAVGWLSARREPNAMACQQAIMRFGKARPFWA